MEQHALAEEAVMDLWVGDLYVGWHIRIAKVEGNFLLRPKLSHFTLHNKVIDLYVDERLVVSQQIAHLHIL